MYQITKEKKIIENEEMIVYGIYYDEKNNVHDISIHKTAVEKLVERCNESISSIV